MSYTKGPWRSEGTKVLMGSKFICSAPCIVSDIDQTIFEGESWLAMRERIHPQIKAAEKEEIEVANLIAAAPEMLEALEMFVSNSTIQANHPAECEAAEKAIAKAKGQL